MQIIRASFAAVMGAEAALVRLSISSSAVQSLFLLFSSFNRLCCAVFRHSFAVLSSAADDGPVEPDAAQPTMEALIGGDDRLRRKSLSRAHVWSQST